MKNKNIICLILFALLAISCNNEENLTPSNKDLDRVATQIDLSNSTTQKLYTDFNMGLLLTYDHNLDFAYVASTVNASNSWGQVEISQLRDLFENADGVLEPANVDPYNQYANNAIEFINTNLFKYFKPNTKIATMMPYKVLLSSAINSPNTLTGESSNVIVESESRFNTSGLARYNQRAVYNSNSIVFDVNATTMANTTANIDKFRKDNCYILLSRILGMHKLYDQIPASFFDDKASYYGKKMEDVYRVEKAILATKYVWVIDKAWFYSKGFIDARYFYGTASQGLTNFTQSRDEDNVFITNPALRPTFTKAILPSYIFVTKEQDVRSYLNEMIHRNATEINAFPQNVKDNMKVLLDVFTSWGIDMVGINSALSVLN